MMLSLPRVTLLCWLIPENKADTNQTAADNPASDRKGDSDFAFEKHILIFFDSSQF